MSDSIRIQKKQATRNEILSAAKQLFLQQGYDATTTRQIAENAEVGIGTVFAHFSDKHTLLRELLWRDIQVVLHTARAAMPAQAGAVQALLHYAGHLYAYYRSQWDLSVVLLKDAMFNPAYFRTQLETFMAELTSRLATDAPQLEVAERVLLAQCLMANYLMVLINGLGTPDSPLEAWLDQLERHCLLLVRPYGQLA